jgi:hypothetical protein
VRYVGDKFKSGYFSRCSVVRICLKARDFSLLRNFYICSAPHPSSYPLGAGFRSRGQSGRGVKLASYLHLVGRLISGAILLPPPFPCLHGVERDKFTVVPLPVNGFLWNLVLREAWLKSVGIFQLGLEYDGSNDCLTWRPAGLSGCM